MSKKLKNDTENNNINYYDLKQDKVNELVDALKNETNEDITNDNKDRIDKKQPNPYKLDKLSRIPTWIKAFFVKFWVAGVICYFFFIGLGYYFNSMIDLVVLVGFTTGIINDLLVNSAFLYFESDKKEYHKFMFLPVSCKKLWTLLINIPLGIVETLIIFLIYTQINQALVIKNNLEVGSTPLSVEPILYGLFYLLIDMIIILIKNMFIKIVKDASNKN